MASYSIETRKLASGEPRFKATVIVKKSGKIIHRESKTFRKKALAQTYGKKRVADLEENGVTHTKAVTIGELLDKYIMEADLWNNTVEQSVT